MEEEPISYFNNSPGLVTGNQTEHLEQYQKPREKCGVFAVYDYSGSGSAALITYLGLLALQHRGQESAGIVFNSKKGLEVIKGMGLVDHVFSRQTLSSIEAATVLGHVRYSTTGTSSINNAQPLLARSFDKTGIALAHNGNLTNTNYLYNKLLDQGHIFHSTSDTEIMLAYIYRYRQNGLQTAVEKTMSIIEGAFSAVAFDGNQLVAFRDPRGYRPLVIGRLGAAYVIASETAALDTVGAAFFREVEPGEIVSIGEAGLSVHRTAPAENSALCIFEFVYFARPDSIISEANVHVVRKTIGTLLAGKINRNIDMVVPSPDSGVSAAIGLAESLKIPLEYAVHRNPYLGRTFIKPSGSDRQMSVQLKFNPIADVIRGKKVAVVDDSLVRGTTARILTGMLKSMGAAEVHLCIASPPYRYPCYYGIDIPLVEDLAASGENYERLAQSIGADSLTFAEPEDLCQAVGKDCSKLCTACFSGEYSDR